MKLRRAAHVAWRRVGDETVLIHLRKKRMYVLNPSGGFFWQTLDGAHDAEQMLSDLALDAPLPDDASDEVEAFIQRLRDAELVEDGSATRPARDEGKEPDALPFPAKTFVPPAMIWQEEIRNFGQSCGFQQGGPDPLCTQVPTM